MTHFYIFKYEAKNKEEHTKECNTFITLLKVYRKMKKKLQENKLENIVIEKWLNVPQDFICVDSKTMHKDKKADNIFEITVCY